LPQNALYLIVVSCPQPFFQIFHKVRPRYASGCGAGRPGGYFIAARRRQRTEKAPFGPRLSAGALPGR